MPTQTFQALLRANLQVPLASGIVPRYSFPEETVRSGGIGDFEPIDLDVSEWIHFLLEFR